MHRKEIKITIIVTSKRKSQHGNKYWEKKIKRKRNEKLEIAKEKQRDRMAGMHQYIDLLSPSKGLSAKSKGFFWAQAI